MNKVLIADNVSNAVFGVFDKYKIEYDQKVGLSEDEICAEIGNYSGLVIRSAVTVTEKIIQNAQIFYVFRLKNRLKSINFCLNLRVNFTYKRNYVFVCLY